MDSKVEQKRDVGTLADLVNESTTKDKPTAERGPLWGTDGEEQKPGDVKQAAWWLAVYVMRVARAHNEAFDKAASDLATKEAPFGTHVDYSRFQTKNIRQCAEDLVPAAFVEPVYYMLQYTWNDSQDWATNLLMQE